MIKLIFVAFLICSHTLFGQNKATMKYILLHSIKTAEITEPDKTHTFHFDKNGNLVQWQISEPISDMCFISEYDSLHKKSKILERTLTNSDTNKIEFFTYPQKNIVKTYGTIPAYFINNPEKRINLYFNRFCIYDPSIATNIDSTVFRKINTENGEIFNRVIEKHKYIDNLLQKSILLMWHSQYPTFVDSNITQYYFKDNELSKYYTYAIHHNKLTTVDSIFFNKKGCFRINAASENKNQIQTYERHGCPKVVKQIPFNYIFTSDNDLEYLGDGILYKAIKRKKLIVTATYN